MRLRFSLRLFLILFTLVAIFFGAAAHFVYRVKGQVRRRKDVSDALDRLGCSLRSYDDWPDDSVPTWLVSLSRKWIDADAFPPLTGVWLDHGVLVEHQTRQQLALVHDLGPIGRIEISVETITTATVDLLMQFKQLRTLELRCKNLSNDAAKRLEKLAGCLHLEVQNPIDDDTAQALAKLSKLEELAIDISRLTLNRARDFHGFSALRELTLFGSASEAAPLASILQSGSLNKVNLDICKLSENSLAALSAAKNVSELRISWEDGNENLFPLISKMPRIEMLIVSASTSQVQHIGALSVCRELSELYLAGVKLTADDFRLIKPVTQLKKLVIEGALNDADIHEYLQGAPTCGVRMKVNRLNDYFFELVDGKLERNWVSPFP